MIVALLLQLGAGQRDLAHHVSVVKRVTPFSRIVVRAIFFNVVAVGEDHR